MLDALRRSVSSWMTKILFVILILSFSIWGVADHIIRQPSERPAITVGDVTISATIVQEEFNRDVTRLRTLLNQPSFTVEDAHKLGFMQQTIQRLAATAALDVAARAYHLTVPDALLAQSLRHHSDFQDETGSFNRTLFQHTIAAQGKSEEIYLRDLRKSLLRIQLSDPLIHAVTVPETLMEHFKRYRYERRVAEIVTLPIVTAPVLPAPDAATLEAFYKAHTATFTTPEYRTLSAILLTRSTVAPLVSLTDEAIQQAYEESLATWRIPEKRIVEHVLLSKREDAEKILRFTKNGFSLARAARAIAHHVTPLGRLNFAEIEKIEPTLATTAFTAALDTIHGPIRSAFGWHLVRVTETLPASIASLALVRNKIKEELIAEKTGDVIYELSGKVEDAINGGASLEEAAQHVGLSVSVFSVERSGIGMDGRIIPDLFHMQDFLHIAFTLMEGSQSIMTENESGCFIVRVDNILHSRLLPIETVSQKLMDKWTTTQYRNAARKQAQAVAERLRAGIALQTAARHVSSSSFKVSQPLLRTDMDEQLPPTFITSLFKLAVGETVVDETAESFIVGRLHSIREPVLNQSTVVDLKREMTQQYTDDILAQFAAAVGREFHATINARVLEVP